MYQINFSPVELISTLLGITGVLMAVIYRLFTEHLKQEISYLNEKITKLELRVEKFFETCNARKK